MQKEDEPEFTQANSSVVQGVSFNHRLSHVIESKEEILNKRATLERRNLINLTKLIVKDLISSSLSVNRTIDDCSNAVHLTNYFTLVERVLKHGLKDNVFSGRSWSLWTALETLPKYLKESTLIAESVRSLANTKTSDGKIRAWMRIGMMQKKLPEYFSELLANKNILLRSIYHDFAFMLNDEAHVFAGLIIGVNVIDCNFFVKDANFDLMDDIIDLSPYLKFANSYDADLTDQSDSTTEEPSNQSDNLKSVLDQKNYLEERNKRLESKLIDLQSKIQGLEEINSKLDMEAKLSEARIVKLQNEGHTLPMLDQTMTSSITGAIKNFIGSSKIILSMGDQQTTLEPPSEINSPSTVTHTDIEENENNSDTVTGVNEGLANSMTGDQSSKQEKSSNSNGHEFEVDDESGPSLGQQHENQIQELKKKLSGLKERVTILEASYRTSLEKIKVLERDLDIQTSINTDKENTIKIYEKDIREKSTQVESLRNSLNDSRKLNSDLSERLNDTGAKLKERLKMVTNLQASLDKWKLENKNLAARIVEKSTSLKSLNCQLETSNKELEQLKQLNEKLTEELRIERESGQSSSVTLETQNSQISRLELRIDILEKELMDSRPLAQERDELAKRCKDYEQSLEEIGDQLRDSRLEVETLRENSAVFLDSQWKDDKQVKECYLCQQSFSVTRRKHHCRLCGNVFCQNCSDNKMELASSSKPARVCDTCHSFLLAKFVKTSTN